MQLVVSTVHLALAPPIESELSLSTGTFLINYDVINRKPELLLIHSTVGKRAKRIPDATVETTCTYHKISLGSWT